MVFNIEKVVEDIIKVGNKEDINENIKMDVQDNYDDIMNPDKNLIIKNHVKIYYEKNQVLKVEGIIVIKLQNEILEQNFDIGIKENIMENRNIGKHIDNMEKNMDDEISGIEDSLEDLEHIDNFNI